MFEGQCVCVCVLTLLHQVTFSITFCFCPQMRDIVAVLGRPPDHMLSTGLYTPQFSKLDIFQLDSAVQSSKVCSTVFKYKSPVPSAVTLTSHFDLPVVLWR